MNQHGSNIKQEGSTRKSKKSFSGDLVGQALGMESTRTYIHPTHA